MSTSRVMARSLSGQIKLSDQEQKAIQFAIMTANQNTIIGQFFSQSTTFLSFIFFLCAILTFSASHVFSQKLDSGQYIPGVLSHSYFKTDTRSYFTSHHLETLQLRFLPHNTRYELFRCQNEPAPSTPLRDDYSILLEYKAQSTANHVKFSIPARSAPADFRARVDFRGGELVLTDRLCVERDVSGGRRYEDELELLQNSARQEFCASLLELSEKTPKEFINILECNSDSACVFRFFLSFQRRVERADAVLRVSVDLERFEVAPDCWYVQEGAQSNWRETPWLLARPLAIGAAGDSGAPGDSAGEDDIAGFGIYNNEDAKYSVFDDIYSHGSVGGVFSNNNHARGLAELAMRHQSVYYVYSLQIFIFCIGTSIFAAIALIFCRKKHQYEERIRQKALQEIRTKQKVHSHLNKMKTLMKKT